MKIVLGQCYVDGYGIEHHIVGLVPGKTGIYWANTGFWFLEDGRLHFRVSAELTKYDLLETTDEHTTRTAATAQAGLPNDRADPPRSERQVSYGSAAGPVLQQSE